MFPPPNPFMAAEAARYVIEDRVRTAGVRRAARETRTASRDAARARRRRGRTP